MSNEKKSGEGGLDLKDLRYGTLNYLRDDTINGSGDRRRGNPLSFLAQTLQKAYGVDTLKTVYEYRGIVIDSFPVEDVQQQNRSEVLNAYLNVSLGEKIVNVFKRDKKIWGYKVYIPELEMRPPPESEDDPTIDTYYDVFDGRESDEEEEEIKKGTVVTVAFEDFENFYNPRIVHAEDKPLVLKFLGGDFISALKAFFAGSPEKEKVEDHEQSKKGGSGGSKGRSPARTRPAPKLSAQTPAEVEHKAVAALKSLGITNPKINAMVPQQGLDAGINSVAKRVGLTPAFTQATKLMESGRASAEKNNPEGALAGDWHKSGSPKVLRFEPHVFLYRAGKHGQKRSTDRKSRTSTRMTNPYYRSGQIPYHPCAARNKTSPYGYIIAEKPHGCKQGNARKYKTHGAVSYTSGETRVDAFVRAYNLEPRYAVEATSWGLYQVLGGVIMQTMYGGQNNAAAQAFIEEWIWADANRIIELSMLYKEAWFHANSKAVGYAKDLNFLKYADTYNGGKNNTTYANKLKKRYNRVVNEGKWSTTFV